MKILPKNKLCLVPLMTLLWSAAALGSDGPLVPAGALPKERVDRLIEKITVAREERPEVFAAFSTLTKNLSEATRKTRARTLSFYKYFNVSDASMALPVLEHLVLRPQDQGSASAKVWTSWQADLIAFLGRHADGDTIAVLDAILEHQAADSLYARGAVLGLCAAGTEGETKLLPRWAAPEGVSANVIAGLRPCSAPVFAPGMAELIRSASASRAQKRAAIEVLDGYGVRAKPDVQRYGAKESPQVLQLVTDTLFSAMEDPDPMLQREAMTSLRTIAPAGLTARVEAELAKDKLAATHRSTLQRLVDLLRIRGPLQP